MFSSNFHGHQDQAIAIICELNRVGVLIIAGNVGLTSQEISTLSDFLTTIRFQRIMMTVYTLKR